MREGLWGRERVSGVAYANCFDAPEARSCDSRHYSRVNGAAETDQAAAVLKHHRTDIRVGRAREREYVCPG